MGYKQVDAMMEEWERKLAGMTYKERIGYLRKLRRAVDEDRQKDVDARGKVLVGVMEDVIGEPILVGDRHSKLVWARALVAYRAVKEGFNHSDVGRILGRDRTTILHLVRNVETAMDMPWMYLDEVYTWKQYCQKLEKHDIFGRTTQDALHMGAAL